MKIDHKRNLIVFNLLVLLFCMSSCGNKNLVNSGSVLREKQPSLHDTVGLQSFLDSIGQLDPSQWIKKDRKMVDSVFYSQTKTCIKLSDNDYAILKNGCLKKKLPVEFVNRIFTGISIDPVYFREDLKKKEIPIEFYSFSGKNPDFRYYAIVPAYDHGFTWECKVYFFHEQNLIGIHKVNHRYGLELDYFTDTDGLPTVFYKQNFESGTGIWWFNYHLYRFSGTEMIPALNILENANLQYNWSFRSYWFESKIVKTKPLTFNVSYYFEFPDTISNSPVRIFEDSTEIAYKWDSSERRYSATFDDSKMDDSKMVSFFINADEYLFIHSFHDILKRILSAGDNQKKQAVYDYLRTVKNSDWIKQRVEQ